VHALAAEDQMLVAELAEHSLREVAVDDLCFLEAQDVGLFFTQEPLDDRQAGADAVYVPGRKLETHRRPLAMGAIAVDTSGRRPAQLKGPRSGGMERGPTWRRLREVNCSSHGPGNRGKTRKGRLAIAGFVLGLESCRPDE